MPPATDNPSDNERLLEAVRRERAEAEARETARRGGVKVELGAPAGRCTPARLTYPDGQITGAIICGGRRSKARC